MSTAAQELTRLIEEQRKDDTHSILPAHDDGRQGKSTVTRSTGALSMDRPWGADRSTIFGGRSTLGDLIGVDEDGELVLPDGLGPEPFNSIPHGTTGGYKNHKCRCPACTRANAEYQAAYMRRKGTPKRPGPPSVEERRQSHRADNRKWYHADLERAHERTRNDYQAHAEKRRAARRERYWRAKEAAA